jgi:hypothetical protein
MVLAAKVPAKDIKAFKEALDGDGVLRSQGHEWTQLEGGVGLILFLRDADSLSDDEKAAFDAWKAESLRPPAHGLVELTLNLSDTLRDQAVGGLALGKMFASQAIAAQDSAANSGVSPAAMGTMLDAYFDLIEIILKGLQQYQLGLDLTADALTAEGSIAAKPDTELAKWLQKPATALTADDVDFVNPEAGLSFAGYFGKEPALMKALEKFLRASFAIQNVDTNGAAVKDMLDLMEKSLPMTFAGSLDLKDKLSLAFAQRFLAADAAEVWAKQKATFTKQLQAFVGKEKLYSAATLTEKNEVIDGVNVDRYSLTLNLDAPMLKMPGQKEKLERLLPGGKIELDYAVKGGRLFMASGGQMKDVLALAGGKSGGKAAPKLDAGTCLIAYLNVLTLAKQIVAAMPEVPTEVQDKLAKLDSKGTTIEFRLSLDQQARFSGRVPLKLISQFGRLAD